jgi:inner membrane protein
MTATQIVWVSLALVLIAIESIAPGVFMLWLGFAAATVFLVLLAAPDIAIVWQAALFVAMGFVFIGVYLRFFRDRDQASDQPLLNRRGEQLVGQVHVLDQPIVDGRGRVKIGDAFWVAEGPELPVGTRVRIVSARNMSLQVERAG